MATLTSLGQHDGITRVTRTNHRLVRSAPPGIYRGDLLFVAAAGAPADPSSWRRYVTGNIEVHALPAGHFDLLRPESLPAIAGILNTALEKSGGNRDD